MTLFSNVDSIAQVRYYRSRRVNNVKWTLIGNRYVGEIGKEMTVGDEDNSKDLKVAVGEEISLQGSRRGNAVPPPTNESGTGRIVWIKVNPREIASNSRAKVVLGEAYSRSNTWHTTAASQFRRGILYASVRIRILFNGIYAHACSRWHRCHVDQHRVFRREPYRHRASVHRGTGQPAPFRSGQPWRQLDVF